MPKPLTIERLLDALYYTSPTGLGQLVRFMKQYLDVDVTGQEAELQRMLATLHSTGKVLTQQVPLGAGAAVTLWGRPGYGLAGG